MQSKIKSLILPFLQPLLIVIYPAAFIFSNNAHEIDMIEACVGLTLLVMLSVICVLFFSLIYKNLVKGALFSSFLLLLFFYFMRLVRLVWDYEFYGRYIRSRHLFILFCLLLLILFARLFYSQKRNYFFSNLWVFPFCVLIVWNFFGFVWAKKQLSSFIQEYEQVQSKKTIIKSCRIFIL